MLRAAYRSGGRAMVQRIGCWLASPIAILRGVLLVLSLLLAQGAVPPGEELLLQAEQAYVAGDFQKVLPTLEAALASPLSEAQRQRAWELRAKTHAAFGDTAAAVAAYRHVLGLTPDYYPPAEASPKLISLLAEARRLGPLVNGVPVPPRVTAPLSATRAPTTEAVAPSPPLWKRGWFWGVVGVTAGAAAAGVGYAGRPEPLPRGNLGQGEMR